MSGSITVPGYNTANRVPGFYFALDSSKANTASPARRILIVAQMLASGTATALQATVSAGTSDAIAKYGAGSQAAIMVAAYRQIDTTGEVWVLPLADDAAAQAATGSITIGSAATASGTFPFYVGDQLIPVGVSTGDSAATIAANIVTAAAGYPSLPVALSANGAAVTATAKNKGLSGNDILLGVGVLGTSAGQAVPAGVTYTLVQMAGGTQNPTTLATGLAGLGTRVFDLLLHPYSDSASLTAFETYLSFEAGGTWSPQVQQYGVALSGFRGSYGEATALDPNYNQGPVCLVAISDSPSSPMQWAAWYGAAAASTMRTNPALPITAIAIPALPPTDAGAFGPAIRESLLYDGFSTFTVDDSGTVYIERIITTYQINAEGVADDSYLDIETLLTAEVCLQDMRIQLASLFGGYILLADGSKIGAGQKATTAQLVGKGCAAVYRQQATELWVQNPDDFASGVQAVNAGKGVVNLLMPYQFANQLWIIAGVCQFTKP